MSSLDVNDQQLISVARTIIAKRFRENYHHIGTALRTKSGKIFAAVHLEAHMGRIAVCAEAIAIGMAAAAGDNDIETIVAVDRLPEHHKPQRFPRTAIGFAKI
jgi:cytidine deaminase